MEILSILSDDASNDKLNEDEVSKADGVLGGTFIPVFISKRNSYKCSEDRANRCHRYVKTIRRDNRGLISLFLPNIGVYNHRSLFPKIDNFITEAKETNQGLTLHSEVWEVSQSKKHQRKINEMLELHGMTYVSTPRRNCQIVCSKGLQNYTEKL